MNRILSRQGFRFYQSSFDEAMQGSWLTVNYDPWGIGVTYSGYLLYILSTMFTSIGESKIPLGLLIFSSILNIEMCIRDR